MSNRIARIASIARTAVTFANAAVEILNLVESKGAEGAAKAIIDQVQVAAVLADPEFQAASKRADAVAR